MPLRRGADPPPPSGRNGPHACLAPLPVCQIVLFGIAFLPFTEHLVYLFAFVGTFTVVGVVLFRPLPIWLALLLEMGAYVPCR